LSSSADSVKPAVTKIILTKSRLWNFGAVQKEVAVYSHTQPFRMTFNVIQEESLVILICQIQLIYKCEIWEKQWESRAEKETLPLQQIAEQEVRQALLTGEAPAVLRSKQNRFYTEQKKSLASC
jgi:hypothetical protein